MAKKDVSQEIVKITPELQLPEYMVDEEVQGLELLGNYIIPPFLKIVQKQASEELLQTFSAGDVILSPLNAMVAEMPRNDKGKVVEGGRAIFQIVPILFYPEWLVWNPIELKGAESAIRGRTLDPNDPIAAKARNVSLRLEPHPTRPDLKIRYIEHLNFIVILYKHGLGREPAILSFSRGEWKSGSKFASLIKMRHAPIYGCIFDVSVGPGMRHNDKGDWYGFDVANPEENGPWVNGDEFTIFKELHTTFSDYHREKKIQAQYEVTEENDEASAKGSEEF